MAIGRSQDGVDVGEFRVGFSGVFSKPDRLAVALGGQSRPPLAYVPQYQQLTSRTQANRLVEVRHSGLIIAAESITCAEIAASEFRVRIELEGTVQTASCLLMTTGKKIKDRQRCVRHRIAVVRSDSLPRRFSEPNMRLGRPISPAKHRLEMPG